MQRHRKIILPLFDELDHALQIIAALAADPQRIALDARLDLGKLIADQLLELFGDIVGDALLERGDLAHAHPADLLDRAPFEDLQRQVAAQRLGFEYVAHGRQVQFGIRCDRQLLFAQNQLGLAVLQIVARANIALGLIDRVGQLQAVIASYADYEGAVRTLIILPDAFTQLWSDVIKRSGHITTYQNPNLVADKAAAAS